MYSVSSSTAARRVMKLGSSGQLSSICGDGWGRLHSDIDGGHVELVRLSIDKGSHRELRNERRRTALVLDS